MANTIKLKQGSGSDPSASDLALGEPAIRTDTGEIFLKKDDGSIAKVAGGIDDGDKGDIVVSNDGGTFTVDAGVITNAKVSGSAAIARTKLANVDLVDDTSPQLGGDLDTNDHHILLDDNHALKMGASTDFQIQHNTNENYIDSNSGHIYIRANVNDDEGDNVYIQPKAGENSAVFTHDGPVELYFNNSLKFHTKNSGVYVTGDIETSGDFYMIDNKRLRIGSGQDLEIKHDGSNSLITNSTGELKIGSDHIELRNAAQNSTRLAATSAGAIELYFSNSKKLETTNTGATVTGDLTATNDIIITGSGEFYGFDNSKIVLGHGRDLEIFSDGSTCFLKSDDLRLRSKTGNENYLTFAANGAATMFFNGSTRLATTANGVSIPQILQMGTSGSYIDLPDNASVYFGTDDDMRIFFDGSDSNIKNSTGNLILQGDSILLKNNGSTESYIRMSNNGAVQIFHDNTTRFETTNLGVSVTGHIFSSTKFRGNDDVKLSLGTSEDLQLYHSGSHSYIKDVGTGALLISTDGSEISLNKGETENMLRAFPDGGVQLFFDAVKKLETSAYGSVTTGVHSISNGILEVKAAIASSHTLTADYNALAVDPTINNGVTVTVPSGAVWAIV